LGLFESISKKKSLHHLEGRLRISEEMLKESEEKFHFLFDYDPNSIFLLKQKNFTILDANARALEIYGYEKKELIGKSFMDLSTVAYPTGVLSPQTDLLGASQTSIYAKIPHQKNDGSTFFVDVYASQTDRSHKHGIIVATIDITETLEKETQLIQASKMSTLGEMAAGVAHELNQPLNTIQIGIDFLTNMVKEGQTISSDELMLVTKQIAEQIDRAVGIINHLREFGRKAEIQMEPFDVNRPIEGVFTLLSQQLNLKDIEVVLELQEDLPAVMGDVNRLEQVILNLVLNARDAMIEKEEADTPGKAEKILAVKTVHEKGQVVIFISDTGIGIPPERKDKIFDPFFTTKELGKGTGLGLSISYGIIKDYKGTVKVESEPGKGTTFEIRFPACEAR
jgi:PAS domain S-box-containing protein